MDFWEDLSGVGKGAIIFGIVALIALGGMWGTGTGLFGGGDGEVTGTRGLDGATSAPAAEE